jgi:AcrR family transcriptional regulator
MLNDTQRPKLTPKGERTRARMVSAAARLIYERGVAGTTLDDVRTAAEVSGSQMYHYFADKDELVQAVIDHQADVIVGNQRRADRDAGHLSTEIDPDDIAVTLLAALQGGLLLAQVQRNTRPLETAVDTLIALTVRK